MPVEKKKARHYSREAQKFLFRELRTPRCCGKTNLLLEIVRNQSGIVYVEYERGRLFDNLRCAFHLLLPSEMLPIAYIPLLHHHLSYINWEHENDVDDASRLQNAKSG